MGRKLLWVDGVNSAVMAKLALDKHPDALVVHCDLGDSVDADSHRFIDDLEQWYGVAITRLRSEVYQNIDEVFEHRRYLAGIHGAPCTGEMKVVPRLNFQLPSDTHYWGYAADTQDAKRFARLCEQFPLLKQKAPLIELGMTKRETHAFLADAGLRRPRVYDLGMPNGNCLGCAKAQSPAYWALMREHFPEVFWRRDAQARKYGAKIVILRSEKVGNKRRNIRGYPSDVPAGHTTKVRGADFGGCGFHCGGGGE